MKRYRRLRAALKKPVTVALQLRTTSLDLRHWLIAIASSSVVLWAEEIAKLIRRARAKA